MSSVIVIAPLVIASWPAITAAVTAAIGTMGFTMARAAAGTRVAASGSTVNRAEIEVEDSEILGATGIEQTIVVERSGVRAIFSRDARGALKVCMEGSNHSKAELQQIGEELLGRVTQQYAYHRIVSELKERNMTIVDEEVAENQTVKIRVKSF
jgi:hypothetical protein